MNARVGIAFILSLLVLWTGSRLTLLLWRDGGFQLLVTTIITGILWIWVAMLLALIWRVATYEG